MSQALLELAADPQRRARLGQAAYEVLERNRGALARVMALIEPLLAAEAKA